MSLSKEYPGERPDQSPLRLIESETGVTISRRPWNLLSDLGDTIHRKYDTCRAPTEPRGRASKTWMIMREEGAGTVRSEGRASVENRKFMEGGGRGKKSRNARTHRRRGRLSQYRPRNFLVQVTILFISAALTVII